MTVKKHQIAVILFIFSFGCASTKNKSTGVKVLPATELHPYGRSFIDHDQKLELISSAVHFGFSFTGTTCKIFSSINDRDGHNYLQYELDGVYQRRLRVNGNDSLPLVISAASDGVHTVWIYKAT